MHDIAAKLVGTLSRALTISIVHDVISFVYKNDSL